VKHTVFVIERALWTAGCLLLLVYAIIRADSAIGSSAAVNQYRSWSNERIAAYRASEGLEAGPLVGTLQIPALQLLVPLYADTDELHLNRGVGLIAGMALPGRPGNVGIAGHRDGFFRVLRDIRKGQRVELSTPGSRYVYEISSMSIVDAADATLLAPTRQRSLTLVTCYPFYFVGPAPRRFVVRGVLISS
jgi:sortase A